MPVMNRLMSQQRGAHRGRRARRRPAKPDHHARGREEADRRGEGGAGEGAGALHVAVRLHAEPDQRDDGHRAAVVAAHGVRPQHRRDQVAGAGRRRHATAGIERQHPGRLRRAHAARRSARDRGRPGVRGDGVGPHIRAYDRDNGKVVWKTDLPTGSEGVPATYEVQRPAVHRVPGGGRTGAVPDPLRRARARGAHPRGAAGPEGAAAAGQGRGRGGRAGGPPPQPGAYIAYALPQK